MCGRFSLSAKTKDIEKLVSGIKIKDELAPRFNIAPTQNIAALLNDGSNELKLIRWGLIPFWAKDKAIGNSMINARSESLLEKPAFKHSFRKKRCLIFADGFYEWKKTDDGKKKVPYFIKLKSGGLFTFAGLWDIWKNPEDNSNLITSTIITTTPNTLMESIHNRMPVILNKENYSIWMDIKNQFDNVLLSCLTQFPSEEMISFEISNRVNNPRIDDELCIKPLN